MKEIKNQKNLRYGLVIGAVVLIAILGLYTAGYRVGTFGIAKAGKVEIIGLPEDTEVFIDSESKGFHENSASFLLTPGEHSIIISKSGFWPYLENPEIESASAITIHPFLIAQNPSADLISTASENYTEARNLFYQETLPKEEDKLISPDGQIAIWEEDGKIMAEWLGSEDSIPSYFCPFVECDSIQIFNAITEVRNISFFKERSDALLISIQNGVFVLEINPESTQNLQPVIEGKEPDFRIAEDGSIYVLDDRLLLLTSL